MRRRPGPWPRPGASRPRPAGPRPLPSSVHPMSCSPRPWPCRPPAGPCPHRRWPCRPRPRDPRPGRRSHSAACGRRRTRPRPPPARRRGRAPRRPPRSASVHLGCSSAAEPRSASRSWSLMTPAFSCAWTSAFASSAFERSFRPQTPRAIATTATPTVAHSHGLCHADLRSGASSGLEGSGGGGGSLADMTQHTLPGLGVRQSCVLAFPGACTQHCASTVASRPPSRAGHPRAPLHDVRPHRDPRRSHDHRPDKDAECHGGDGDQRLPRFCDPASGFSPTSSVMPAPAVPASARRARRGWGSDRPRDDRHRIRSNAMRTRDTLPAASRALTVTR